MLSCKEPTYPSQRGKSVLRDPETSVKGQLLIIMDCVSLFTNDQSKDQLQSSQFYFDGTNKLLEREPELLKGTSASIEKQIQQRQFPLCMRSHNNSPYA